MCYFKPKLNMKLLGFLLLLAGCALFLTAIAILPSPTSRAGFVLAGCGVEVIGLVLVVRAHLPTPEAAR